MTAQRTIEVATANENSHTDVPVKATVFKVGFSYDVFLRKNGIPPSEHAQKEWLTLSREANKNHVATIAQLAASGAKCKGKRKAVFNRTDQRFDTRLTVEVTQPGCNDSELITEALLGARMRFAKTLELMEAVANHQGIVTTG